MLPIFEAVNAQKIVEIGSGNGIKTENILEYCKKHNARMIAIDPFPNFDVAKYKTQYGDIFEHYPVISLNRLPSLKDFDTILIDGNHNWVIVYNELKIIEVNFKPNEYPIIFFTAIPDNKPQNRILNAITDFINESDLNFSFKLINRFSGLGILYIKNDKIDRIIKKVTGSVDLVDILEDERIKLSIILAESEIQNKALQNEYNKNKNSLTQQKNKLNTVKSKLNQAENQLNIKEIQLNKTETQLNHIGSRMDHSKNKLNSSDVQIMMTQNDNQVEKLYDDMDYIKSRFYEMRYLNNYNRSIVQRLISKFPNLYLLLKMNNSSIKKALINIKGYKAIKKHNLFDLGYYLKTNEDVRSSGADPILHYMYCGFNEGRRPHPEFDSNYYLKNYSDVQKSNLNPLIHYSLYGIQEGRRINKKNLKNNLPFERLYLKIKEHSKYQINNILKAVNSNKIISIIISIYNNYEYTKKCVDSVLKYTKIPYELILIDDCSTDKRIRSLLKRMDEQPNVKIIFNQDIQGHIKNINTGIKHSDGDVVILDNNTVVTSKWLQKLVVASYSDEKIGTVIPFSNAAGAFSVPEVGKKNGLPVFLTLDGMASLVEKISNNINMEIPTDNGFCIFIKRTTINNVGLFNEETLGSLDENDFFVRAAKGSWKHILDDSTYIYHNGDKLSSYKKDEQDKLIKEQRAILDQKHPADIEEVTDFKVSVKLAKIQDNIKTELDNLNFNRINYLNKKRILYIFSQDENRTPGNKDILRNIQKTFECFILTSTSKELILWKYSTDKIKQIKSWKLKWSQKELYNDEFRDLYFNLLTSLKIDIVHILDLFKHTFDLPDTAYKLGLPIILSINNDYLFQSDPINDISGGNASTDNTNLDNGKITSDDESILEPFNEEWKTGVVNLLKKCSTLITTQQLAIHINSFYPELEGKQFKRIKNSYTNNQINDIDFKYTKEIAYEFESTYCQNLFVDKNSDIKGIYRVAIFVRGRNGRYPPTANIRLILPFYHPTLYGKVVPHIIDENFIDKISKDSFLNDKTYDCIIVQRDILEMPFAMFLVKKCQELDIKLIYEIDDDLLGIDETHSEYENYKSQSHVIKYLIKNADIVTVSTSNLKEKLDDMADVRLIFNALDERLWCNKNNHPPNEDNMIKIGYMGSFTHGKDLNIIKNIITDLKSKFAKNNINLIFEVIGGVNKNVTDNWFHQIQIPQKNHSYPLFVEWLKNTINWDMAIAPLTDVPLNQSKSEIKYLEYTGLGLSAVYSDVGPYHETIRNGYNGLLVKNNNITEWEDQITKLINDKELSKKIKSNARKNIGKEYLIKYRTATWYGIIKELVDSN
jgi:GT2 family glycosyltransferase/glycosyltransferase involved in cell wall biosynthesis